jgi:hypothetical protein
MRWRWERKDGLMDGVIDLADQRPIRTPRIGFWLFDLSVLMIIKLELTHAVSWRGFSWNWL